ncbi:MAG: pyridoxal-phosphate dependent enzyme [Actinomycetota bacterium]
MGRQQGPQARVHPRSGPRGRGHAADRLRRGTSNWTSALAWHGARQGFEVSIVLTANAVPDSLARLYESLGTEVRHVNRAWFPAAIGLARLRGGRVLPPGGTGAEGDRGAAHAGEEIAAEISAGLLPRPAKTFVAVGTGGTAAGIAMGAAAHGEPLDLVCVRVAPKPFGTTRRVARRLGSSLAERLEADERFFRPGYARPNAASREAAILARLDGLELDATYAAKAFASLVAHARAGMPGPLLFVHTSSGPVPSAGE